MRIATYKHPESHADKVVKEIVESCLKGGKLRAGLLDRCKWGGVRPQDIEALIKRLKQIEGTAELIGSLERLHWNEEEDRYD